MNTDNHTPVAHLRALADTTPDAFVTIDSSSRIRYVNPSIEETLGYTAEELRGEPLTVLMPEALADRHLEAVDRYLATDTRTLDWEHIELPGQHRDGHRVPLQISFSEFTLDGEQYFSGVLRDISERKSLESERDLLHATREEILEAETFSEGLETGVRLLGQSMNWAYGEAWLPSEESGEIEWETAWTGDDSTLDEFRDASDGMAFERGEGLIGRAWETGEHEWLPDLSAAGGTGFERSAAARAAGFEAALAVPILSDGDVSAVLVFFASRDRQVDEREVEVTRTVSANLGFVLSRQRARDSLRSERNLVSNILETTPVGILVVEAGGAITYANERAQSVLRFEEREDGSYPDYGDLSFRVFDPDGEPLVEADYPFRRVLRAGEDVTREVQVAFPDGERRWFSVHGTPFGDGDRKLMFAFQDVSEEKRRAGQLERLNELGRDLSEAESFQEGCERAVAAARDILGLSVTSIELYDADEGALVPRASTPRVDELVGDESLFASARGLPWQAFVDGEPRVYSDLEAAELADAETPLSSVLVLPIDSHGVLISGATEPDSFDESVVTLARILAQNAASAFDRLDRELSLREQKAELESKNEQLERVQRVNREIRDITRSLMDAESSAEIKQFVCDQLADSDTYRFVWFGERDLATDEVVPVASAGVEEGYLDAVTVTADAEATGLGPAGRAVRTREPQVQNDLQSDPPFEPWRKEAMERGYRAAVTVPVVYNETMYGLLSLYANEPGVLSDMEEAVLSELGEMIGFALNSRERYNAAVAEESVELEFAVRESQNPLMAFLREHDGKVSVENVVTRSGDEAAVFATFENVPFDAIRAFTERQSLGEITLIRERDGETIVEIPAPSGTFVRELLDRGAVPTGVRGAPGEGRVTIRLSKTASAREFVEFFADRFGDVELVARRELDDPVRTTEGFERAYLGQLTERQEEVLRTAFFAGFFEQPRASSARDVAAMLDVSQPTVSRHIRAGEAKLFSMLFGDPGPR